jgi:hypothetical protein
MDAIRKIRALAALSLDLEPPVLESFEEGCV